MVRILVLVLGLLNIAITCSYAQASIEFNPCRCALTKAYLDVGMGNHLTIKADTAEFASLSVLTDNGEIYFDRNYLSAMLVPRRVGVAHVAIRAAKNKEGPQYIFDTTLTVGRGSINLLFNSQYTGTISAYDARKAYGVRARICGYCNSEIHVLSYEVVVKRGDTEVYHTLLEDWPGITRLDTPTKRFFKKLKNGDSLQFRNIVCRDMDDEKRNEGDLKFIITDADKPDPKGPFHRIDPICGIEWDEETEGDYYE